MWGGISYRGRTHCCIFTGTMDSIIYQEIIRCNLIPFVERQYPSGFRLYQVSSCIFEVFQTFQLGCLKKGNNIIPLSLSSLQSHTFMYEIMIDYFMNRFRFLCLCVYSKTSCTCISYGEATFFHFHTCR